MRRAEKIRETTIIVHKNRNQTQNWRKPATKNRKTEVFKVFKCKNRKAGPKIGQIGKTVDAIAPLKKL